MGKCSCRRWVSVVVAAQSDPVAVPDRPRWGESAYGGPLFLRGTDRAVLGPRDANLRDDGAGCGNLGCYGRRPRLLSAGCGSAGGPGKGGQTWGRP